MERGKSAAADTMAAAATAVRPMSSLLAFRLIRLADRISRGASLVYEKRFGITNVELRVLIVLHEGQPLSINELSRRANTDKGWISRAVRALEDRKLVRREAHASDSRVSLVSLTEEGEGLVARIIPVALDRHDRLVGDLDAPALEEIMNALERHAEELLQRP